MPSIIAGCLLFSKIIFFPDICLWKNHRIPMLWQTEEHIETQVAEMKKMNFIIKNS